MIRMHRREWRRSKKLEVKNNFRTRFLTISAIFSFEVAVPSTVHGKKRDAPNARASSRERSGHRVRAGGL
jgi:hypothetical protein